MLLKHCHHLIQTFYNISYEKLNTPSKIRKKKVIPPYPATDQKFLEPNIVLLQIK